MATLNRGWQSAAHTSEHYSSARGKVVSKNLSLWFRSIEQLWNWYIEVFSLRTSTVSLGIAWSNPTISASRTFWP